MYQHQSALFKDQQWSGWNLFLDDLLHRETVQAAWKLSQHTFDTDFQLFMDGKIREAIAQGPPAGSSRRCPGVAPTAWSGANGKHVA